MTGKLRRIYPHEFEILVAGVDDLVVAARGVVDADAGLELDDLVVGDELALALHEVHDLFLGRVLVQGDFPARVGLVDAHGQVLGTADLFGNENPACARGIAPVALDVLDVDPDQFLHDSLLQK